MLGRKGRKIRNLIMFPREQRALVLLFVVYVLLGCLISGAIFSYSFQSLITSMEATHPVAALELARAVGSVANMIWLASAGYLILTIFGAIYLSHKIYGPLVRINAALARLADGEKGVPPLKLRKGDQMIPLAHELNRLLESHSETH